MLQEPVAGLPPWVRVGYGDRGAGRPPGRRVRTGQSLAFSVQTPPRSNSRGSLRHLHRELRKSHLAFPASLPIFPDVGSHEQFSRIVQPELVRQFAVAKEWRQATSAIVGDEEARTPGDRFEARS